MKQGEKLETFSGKAIPLHGNDIDTDRIIPARYMRCVTFRGLGKYAMYDERFSRDGKETDHVFNKKEYTHSPILLVNKNFGCGSSREHAPWALYDFGIRLIVGESFAEIFAGNCNSLGIPAVIVTKDRIRTLMDAVETDPGLELTVDLKNLKISYKGGSMDFTMPETYRQALLKGKWDTTSILLQNEQQIRETAEKLPYLSW